MAGEKLYRANWVLDGHKGKTVMPGETIRLRPEEAEPYLGGVLSLVEDQEEQEAGGKDKNQSK